jgi:2-polyprenyl-3-methyl-5-hydroxy-6-metoxy-1,4-benzoquinol methylase
VDPSGAAGYGPSVIYQHPLAYLLGLEGVALLRAWAGDYDREFVEARLAEVRRLLDDEALVKHEGVVVGRGDLATGYRSWAATYDEPRNSLFDSDEPVMHDILDALPAGTVLDAACGTGRYAAYLVARGHRVVGVDSSPEMLDRARTRLPDATFLRGDLHRLPLTDGAVDVVVCALALVHVPSLAPVLAEFARVLRPGGEAARNRPARPSLRSSSTKSSQIRWSGRTGRHPAMVLVAVDEARRGARGSTGQGWALGGRDVVRRTA